MRITSPYQDIESAFLPFLTDRVQISGERKGKVAYSTSIRCCMFDTSSIDPFSSVDIDTDTVDININFPVDFWKETIDPKIGDTIETVDYLKYKIYSVKKNNGFFDVIGRSVK